MNLLKELNLTPNKRVVGRNSVVEGNGYYSNYTLYVEDYRLSGV